jgi:hypothetical protein
MPGAATLARPAIFLLISTLNAHGLGTAFDQAS